MIKCVKIIVTGKVQGVWFRKYTKQAADSIGIVGSVMNQYDGSVLCIAQGTEEQIARMLEFCRKGSPLSSVKKMSTSAHEIIKTDEFIIVR